MEYISTINKINRSDNNIVGFRAVDLAELHSKKTNIPICFVIKNNLFAFFLEKNNLKEAINKILSETNNEDNESLNQAYKKIKELIMNIEFPSNIQEELIDAYETLAIDLDHINIAKLVTSIEKPFLTLIASPNYIEEYDNKNMVTQNVKGKLALFAAIKTLWSSLYTPEAIKYRAANDIKQEQMSIIIQRMIDTQISAQIEVRNNQIKIETFFGFQDYDGLLGKDITIMSQDHLAIKNNKVNFQEYQLARDIKDGILIKKALKEEGETQKLNDRDVEELGRIAKKIESYLEKPIKIYFGINKGKIHVLFVNRIAEEKKHEEIKVKEENIEIGNISLEDDISFLDNIEQYEKQEEMTTQNNKENLEKKTQNDLEIPKPIEKIDEIKETDVLTPTEETEEPEVPTPTEEVENVEEPKVPLPSENSNEEFVEREEDDDYIAPEVLNPKQEESNNLKDENWSEFETAADELKDSDVQEFPKDDEKQEETAINLESEQTLALDDENLLVNAPVDKNKQEALQEDILEQVSNEPKEDELNSFSTPVDPIDIQKEEKEMIDFFGDERDKESEKEEQVKKTESISEDENKTNSPDEEPLNEISQTESVKEESDTTDDFIFSEMTKEIDTHQPEIEPTNEELKTKETPVEELEKEVEEFPANNLEEAHQMVRQIAIVSYKEIFNALARRYNKITGNQPDSFEDMLKELKHNEIRVPFEKELKKIKKIKEKAENNEELEVEESTMALRTANNFLSIFE